MVNQTPQQHLPSSQNPNSLPNLSSRPNQTKLPTFFFVVLLIFKGLILDIFSLVRAKQSNRFKNNLIEYCQEYEFAETTSPKIKGKLVVVNLGERKVDELHFDLPSRVKATKPQEVANIVQLDFVPTYIGNYGAQAKAYKYTAYVTIIDVANCKAIAKIAFEGSHPPATVKAGYNGYGSKPLAEIKDYILSLHTD